MRRPTKVVLVLTFLFGVFAFTSLHMRTASSYVRCVAPASILHSGSNYSVVSSSVDPSPPVTFLNPTGKAKLTVGAVAQCGAGTTRTWRKIYLTELPLVIDKQGPNDPRPGCPDFSSVSITPTTLGDQMESLLTSIVGPLPGIDLDAVMDGGSTLAPECLFSTGSQLVSQALSHLMCLCEQGLFRYSCGSGDEAWACDEFFGCAAAEAGLTPTPSKVCGDGDTDTDEACDDGDANGTVGMCN